MDRFLAELNDILMEVYHNVLRLEEQTLKESGRIQLSINEMHLIECVGKRGTGGATIRELAASLGVKSPSVTVAVGKLQKKGYVEKMNCENDGRVVRVFLTREGRRVDAYHKFYHRRMVKRLSAGFTEGERDCLLKAVRKLNDFFIESIGETT